MITRLRGILIFKKAPIITVDINGVGYEVYIPLNSFYHLPQIGEEIILHTHFVVREDSQTLYGFLDEKQRDLFRKLIKVSGVGPKLALTILSGIEPEVLIRCILNGDDNCLVRIPGIGKKTAQRLLIETRDSLGNFENYVAKGTEFSKAIQDAISALVALGYKPQEASKAISKYKDKKLSSEELIKMALKDIN